MRHALTVSMVSILMTAMLTVAVLLSASLAYAQNSRLVLEAVDNGLDGTLVLDIVAENVTELYGAEFQLKYDPTVFSAQDVDPQKEGVQIEAGPFLPAEQGFVVVNQVDERAGTVTYALTLLNPAPPVTGTGGLARITFNVLQADAASTIEFENAKLVSYSLQTIPSELTPFDYGNGQAPLNAAPSAEVPAIEVEPQPEVDTAPAVEVEPQPEIDTAPPLAAEAPAANPQPQADTTAEGEVRFPIEAVEQAPAAEVEDEFPWWIVALGIILLGFMSLGIFAIVGGAYRPQPAAGAAGKTTINMPAIDSASPSNQPHTPKHVQGTRPSAFK